MSKSISLTIQMNSPCNEDWSSMEPTEQGRFCNNCQKPVVNFADLTDQQILNYFLKHPFPVCGRMLHTKKGQTFLHSKPGMNRNLSPVAATLFTLSAITAEAALPAPFPVSNVQEHLIHNQQAPGVPTDSVYISGTVKNGHGEPIENAEIIFDQHRILSGKNGSFQITLPSQYNKPGIIQFSYGNLVREVRSYHPLMGTTSFDVMLYEPQQQLCMTMGNILPTFHLPDSLATFSFRYSNKLDVETKTLLSKLANFMRNDPYQKIILRSYYKTTKQKGIKLSHLIKNFLESEEGINAERIQLADPQLKKDITSEVIVEFADQD